MDASRVQPIKLARVTRVLGRTGSQGQCTQKGGKRAAKRKHSVEDVEASKPNRDFSDEDISKAESCASGFDSDVIEWQSDGSDSDCILLEVIEKRDISSQDLTKSEPDSQPEPEKSTPVKPGKSTLVKPGKSTPVKPGKSTPVKPGKSTPVKPGKSTPVKPGKSAPVKPGKSAPVKPGKSAPVKPAKSAPVKPGKSAPVKPGKSAPVKPGKSTPVKPGKTAPVKSAKSAPVKSAKNAPVKSAKSTPVKPAKSTPVKRARLDKDEKGRGRVTTPKKTKACMTEGRWNDTGDPDITPLQPIFRPARPPGSQLIVTAKYTPLQLFQEFFSHRAMMTLLKNTNVYGRAHNAYLGRWTDVTMKEMFSFLSIVIYMGFVKASSIVDYWRRGALYSLPFPSKVITGRRFRQILGALHLNSPEDDAANDAKRGTAEFDRLAKIKPLYTDLRDACRKNYQPTQNISIDERMVATKARVMFKQYMKNKPVKWGFKLFVLADSSNGYTWDFFVYEGKSTERTGKGLGYDTVMSLLNLRLLGSGYKLYVDNFYTSPTLLRDLLEKRVWACGTIRTKQSEFPKMSENALDAKSPRGSIRWIRDGSLLFLQWRDTRDVSLCSTIHTAHGPETVERKTKEGKKWTIKEVPIPPVVQDYNRHMGGVDLSDALICYYDVLHKTKKWYKTLFYHFVDIAIVNALILHKALCQSRGETPMVQKAFRERLVMELAEAGSKRGKLPNEGKASQNNAPRQHRLVYLGQDKTADRLRCRKCGEKTPVKCATCDKPLCFMPLRDCYNEWHQELQ